MTEATSEKNGVPAWLSSFMEKSRLDGIAAAKHAGGMTIGDVIEAIEAYLSNDWQSWNTPDVTLAGGGGLANPHSYRGYYDRLALEPHNESVDARELARQLRGCVGETFMGYKGGSYRMERDTLLHVANYGDCGRIVTGVRYVKENEYVDHLVIETSDDD